MASVLWEARHGREVAQALPGKLWLGCSGGKGKMDLPCGKEMVRRRNTEVRYVRSRALKDDTWRLWVVPGGVRSCVWPVSLSVPCGPALDLNPFFPLFRFCCRRHGLGKLCQCDVSPLVQRGVPIAVIPRGTSSIFTLLLASCVPGCGTRHPSEEEVSQARESDICHIIIIYYSAVIYLF